MKSQTHAVNEARSGDMNQKNLYEINKMQCGIVGKEKIYSTNETDRKFNAFLKGDGIMARVIKERRLLGLTVETEVVFVILFETDHYGTSEAASG